MEHTTVSGQSAAAGASTEMLKSISDPEVVWSSSYLRAASQALNQEQYPHHLKPMAESQEQGGLRDQPQREQQRRHRGCRDRC